MQKVIPSAVRTLVLIWASVTFTTYCFPSFMVMVSVSSLVNGNMLIKAQSPARTDCALISLICSFVSSALYWQTILFACFSSPTVVSVVTFLIHTSSGSLNSTEATSATNFRVASLTSTSPNVIAVFVSDFTLFSSTTSLVTFSSVSSAISDPFSSLFFSEFVSPASPSTSTSCCRLTNPPPGRLNSYSFPFTS